jgi:hypothetical protein
VIDLKFIDFEISPVYNLIGFDKFSVSDYNFNIEIDYNGREVHTHEYKCINHDQNTLTYRLYFYPALKPSEIVDIHYTYTIPAFKIATVEELQRKSKSITGKERSTEYFTYRIRYPIEKFIFQASFDSNCKIHDKERISTCFYW